jgi:prophage regulatory protein
MLKKNETSKPLNDGGPPLPLRLGTDGRGNEVERQDAEPEETSENRASAGPDGGDRAPDEPRARRMLTEREVLRLVPFSRSTLWRREREGSFPRGSYISANRKIWFEDEVCAWQRTIEGQGRGRKNQKGFTLRAGDQSGLKP